MGLFGVKPVTPQMLAEHPVAPQYHHLLGLATQLTERDHGAGAQYTFYDQRKGKGTKYLYQMWEINNLATLDDAVSSLLTRSRDTGRVKDRTAANQRVADRYARALKKQTNPGVDYSPERIAAVTDLGAGHLEYAASLLRKSMALNYAPEEAICERLEGILGEVRSRFATWNDYLISADKWIEFDCTFGMPDTAPVYLRLAADPNFAFTKYPLN